MMCAVVAIMIFCHRVDAAPKADAFQTPLESAALDADAFSQWVDGATSPVALREGPNWVIWTRTTQPGHNGVTFGDSKTPGVRHLRIGFKSAIPVGSVLVKSGGSLSVLKANAAYPGDLADESIWIPATRLVDARPGAEEVSARGEFAVWVLPPGTVTRALRFTHVAALSDTDYSGWLGGAEVLADRVANIAPQAIAGAGSRNEAAPLINNLTDDGTWKTWDNGRDGAAQIVSADHPEYVMLVWAQDVPIRALNALWAGFGAVDVQVYTGPKDRHPREAAATDWKTVGTFDKIENQYPRTLGVDWLDLGQAITTRAVRLRITRPIPRAEGHLKGKTFDGKRIWLGELMAFEELGDGNLKTAILPAQKEQLPAPPIAVRFTLKEPGYVTLVIEKPDGTRVRNLVSETHFPAGENTVAWDGSNDLLRDKDAAAHGIYYVPAQFVDPGEYRVRGLVRKEVDLHYEFPVYNAGAPAWNTADHTGGWLANHTPPSSALYVPGDRAPGGKPVVLLGSYVTEGGDGLAYVDLDGRKLGGQGWVGGNWTGAPFLARDAGPQTGDVFAYAAAAWTDDAAPKNAQNKHGEIRITALTTFTAQGNRPILKYSFLPEKESGAERREDAWGTHLGGIAVRDGVLVFSLARLNQLVFVDVAKKAVVGKAPLHNPRGLAFDAQGRLLVLSGTQLLRYPSMTFKQDPTLPTPEVLVHAGLEDPQQIALADDGSILISDRGNSDQVKIFTAAGRFVRAIGDPGKPAAGKYDPSHLNDPNGLTIDGRGCLWVAETNFQPKRVSVWTLDGKLANAFYGPSEYGGGGKLDPQDKNRFYYHGMEFALDWRRGTSQLSRVFFRAESQPLAMPQRSGVPETPVYVQGRRYFSNCDDSNPTGGAAVCLVWLDRGEIAVPVAAMGRANDWDILKADEFKSLWPAGLDRHGDAYRNPAMFLWSDLNGDGLVQPNEVKIVKARTGAVTVMPDLSLVESRVNDLAVRYAPRSFTAVGVPVYDLAAGETIIAGAQSPTSSGGDQVLIADNGWSVLTIAPAPFAPQSMGGVFKGQSKWSYPSLWPGLHASHESPPPEMPGELIGTTRLLGGFVTPAKSDAGPIWAINGNMGNAYLFTADGLFVATLFQDERRGNSWAMPAAPRGMLLNDVTMHGENFWPTITQTPDGEIYLVDGGRTSLVRVDGLETIRRLPESTLTLSAKDLQNAQAAFVEREAARQQLHGQDTLIVPIVASAPVVDGKLEDWASAHWVDIDKSGVAAWFNSDSKPHNVSAAVAVSGDRLYAAFRTDDANLLLNSGEMPAAPFKTGGALDLMIGANPAADPKRTRAVEGDQRLLVTQIKGKTFAVLYRAVVPGTKEAVPFSSPWRTITLDRVDDVSAQVTLASSVIKSAKGKMDSAFYEFSIPLSTLGLNPRSGETIRGDLGILRGDGTRTMQRVYWSNKATGITADVPSEAELTPKLWSRWHFLAQQ
ncbi:MAG TPA: hypothetical protein VG326_19795 [Tepidisphaeraceae bacterium]|jgi:hypothetical protein|nr:hypothetical protein [Tepidisphaeraceae bacterium]